jgi:glycosyltransferase involved in cell wall biosynthesis
MSDRQPVRVLELRSVRGTGGGPEKTILLGAARADRSRVHVVVCYIRDERDDVFSLGSRARDLGLDYVEVTERHSLDTSVLSKLVDVVHEHRIDLVHAHEYKTDLLALLLARRTGIVPLATAHGWTGHSGRERFVYYPIDKWLLARYPRVIAVSSDIRNQLLRYGARPDRLTVILNSIDPDAFRRQPERQASVRDGLGLPHDAVVVGAVGRAEPQKRFDLLLEAMVPVFRTRPDVRLVVAGDGSQLASLKQHARDIGVADVCTFTGHRQDVADLHHAFDLFVQSSEYEGTPNAVLEAMAMETPIVATDCGGTAELVSHDVHGLIVPVHDVPALTKAIERVLDEPTTARERATAARRRIETDLSFATRTRKLEDIYVELVRA